MFVKDFVNQYFLDHPKLSNVFLQIITHLGFQHIAQFGSSASKATVDNLLRTLVPVTFLFFNATHLRVVRKTVMSHTIIAMGRLLESECHTHRVQAD